MSKKVVRQITEKLLIKMLYLWIIVSWADFRGEKLISVVPNPMNFLKNIGKKDYTRLVKHLLQ